jgi:hypothetical protein
LEEQVSANHLEFGKYPRKFLKAVYGSQLAQSGMKLEIRCIHFAHGNRVVRRFYGSLGELKEGWEDLQTLNHDGYNIFFAVALRDPKNDYQPPQPILLTCLWVDIDVGPDKSNKTLEDALRRLHRLGSRPTICVKSGHGLHAYWCLTKPAILDPSDAKQLLRALAKATGGDMQCAEVARLLRMPHTINWKEHK